MPPQRKLRMRNRLARRRQLAGLKQGDGVPVVEIFPQREKGHTRDIIARAIGLGSGRQWDKLEYVAEGTFEDALLAGIRGNRQVVRGKARHHKQMVKGPRNYAYTTLHYA